MMERGVESIKFTMKTTNNSESGIGRRRRRLTVVEGDGGLRRIHE